MSRNMLTTETNGFEFLKRNKQNVNIGTIKIVRKENLLGKPNKEMDENNDGGKEREDLSENAYMDI